VSLSGVFGHVNMYELDDIVSNGGGEDSWEGDLLGFLELFGVGVKD